MISLKWFLIGGLVGLLILAFIRRTKEITEIYNESLEEIFELLEEED